MTRSSNKNSVLKQKKEQRRHLLPRQNVNIFQLTDIRDTVLSLLRCALLLRLLHSLLRYAFAILLH